MRKGVVPALAIAMTMPAILSARSDDIPTLDVNPVCHGITMQGGLEAGLQQTSFQQCVQSEQEVREQLKKQWSTFSAADKQHCVSLAKTGGESSYTELLTCLEMARDVRQLRGQTDKSAGPAPEGLPAPVGHRQPTSQSSSVATTRTPSSRSQSSLYLSTRSPSSPPPSSPPPSSPSMAMVQPAPPTNEPWTSIVKELQQAKVDAINARASESTAQRKLTNTEADLKQAKDEAAQAIKEAEQAKMDAKKAQESRAQAESKLAAAEAAQVAAEESEKACQNAAKTQPGFGERLRSWFGGKPSNP
jgi:membrane-associated HD superfamily phosphohydrolase